jgi:PII-like signaling protein
MIPADASLLSLYVNASYRWRGKPLYRAVAETARSLPVAGASVFLVDLSYGAHRTLRDAKNEYAFVDVPVVIEVVDALERVETLVAALATVIVDGLITIERVRVVHHTHHDEKTDAGATRVAPASEHRTESREGGPHVPIEGDVQKATVYIGSSDTWQGRNLAMAIIERCRTMGMAGATASLGALGFGKHSVIHRAHRFGLSSDLPEKIEIIDRPDRIAAILPILEEMVDGGLIVVQNVRVVRYESHPGSTPQTPAG